MDFFYITEIGNGDRKSVLDDPLTVWIDLDLTSNPLPDVTRMVAYFMLTQSQGLNS